MELLLPRVREPARIPPSYIKLDMAFGVGAGSTLFDKSRYRAHGTISGALWAAGAHGYSLDFIPATPSYVSIPTAYDQLDFTSEKFSIISRIYIDDISASREIFCRHEGTTEGYLHTILSTGEVSFYSLQAAAYQTYKSTAGDIVIGTWYTIGVSRDGVSVKLYKNGVDVTLVTEACINPVTCDKNAYIGYRYELSANPFDGHIEFLRVFGGIALPASTHLAYHNALA